MFGNLIKLERTEFLFFISSAFIHRFADRPEIKKYHPKFDSNKISSCSRKKIHYIISEEFEKYVPLEITDYAIIPFSIMKSDKNNIYGLIFVTRHILGAEKFLNTLWEKNRINGSANYDIDEDLEKDQGSLF